ncbi:MCM DNA helicase complex subunit mcm6 [Knufia obscura]|uniref:MCM DNA helicase complex subunit mcm6 n=1 Tax=Knufia obscura TaxID=1635080 RepID=A0ABR0RXY2_9EURO|nr:MCM DNA helicase complex subunit mcm6 [Knufia obscura]
MSRFDLFFIVLDECNESVDRHLASHIVNLHMLKDDFVTPEFSTEQLQRYIRFARTFQPLFTPGAKKLLVTKYKDLRSNDSGGLGRNSYRITVRQLESLIRLSEAIAKANCVEEVTEGMVVEAYNLLRMSIISVERDDVGFDESDDEGGDQDGEGVEGDEAMGDVDGDGQREASAMPEQAARPRTKISADKYTKMRNIFIKKLADDEERVARVDTERQQRRAERMAQRDGDAEDQDQEDEEEEQDPSTAVGGVEQNDLLLHYLESVEEELAGPEDMEREQKLAKKVLRRMEREMEVMVVRAGGGAEQADGGREEEGEREGTVVRYVLHPNVSLEEG